MPRGFLPVLLAILIAGGAAFPEDSKIPLDSIKTVRAARDTIARPSQSRADSVLVVRHRFNHREQIITGGVVMACLIGILAFMNNYNPQ
jgi:hypothetical protein